MDSRMHYLAPVIPFEQFVVDHACGSYLFDKNENKILDINSGQFCTVLGHSNPELSERVGRMAQKHQHSCTSVVSEGVLSAAEKINRISGDMDARVLLLSTGSEAVEACLRYAKHISGKDGVVCFSCGYHGLTMGSQSITYSGVYARPLVPRIFPIDAPEAGDEKAETRSLDALETAIRDHGDEIGLVILEPIVSVGGLIYPSEEYLQKVHRLAKDSGMLFAFDESQTGFGRTGRWFAFQGYDIRPDFVICSKGIGLGYPVAALLFAGDMVDGSTITMTHYSSHQNDSFAAGIIEFGIDYIESRGLLERVIEIGGYFLRKLEEVERECECLVKARGSGLMLGIDFSLPGVDDYRSIYRVFHGLMLENGVLIQGTDGGRVLRFLPDYLVTENEIDLCVAAMKRSCSELMKRVSYA